MVFTWEKILVCFLLQWIYYFISTAESSVDQKGSSANFTYFKPITKQLEFDNYEVILTDLIIKNCSFLESNKKGSILKHTQALLPFSLREKRSLSLNNTGIFDKSLLAVVADLSSTNRTRNIINEVHNFTEYLNKQATHLCKWGNLGNKSEFDKYPKTVQSNIISLKEPSIKCQPLYQSQSNVQNSNLFNFSQQNDDSISTINSLKTCIRILDKMNFNKLNEIMSTNSTTSTRLKQASNIIPQLCQTNGSQEDNLDVFNSTEKQVFQANCFQPTGGQIDSIHSKNTQVTQANGSQLIQDAVHLYNSRLKHIFKPNDSQRTSDQIKSTNSKTFKALQETTRDQAHGITRDSCTTTTTPVHEADVSQTTEDQMGSNNSSFFQTKLLQAKFSPTEDQCRKGLCNSTNIPIHQTNDADTTQDQSSYYNSITTGVPQTNAPQSKLYKISAFLPQVGHMVTGWVSHTWHCALDFTDDATLDDIHFYLFTPRNRLVPEEIIPDVSYMELNTSRRKKDTKKPMMKLRSTWIVLEGVSIGVRYLLSGWRQNSITNKFVGLDPAMSIVKSEHFNTLMPTKIIIHGYSQNCEDSHMRLIREAYLSKGIYNVIMVDWCNLAIAPCYVRATRKSRGTGQLVALLIDQFALSNVNIQTFHLIGFSLGAQVAGFAGMYISHGDVGRITDYSNKEMGIVKLPATAMADVMPTRALPHIDAKMLLLEMHFWGNKHSLRVGNGVERPNSFPGKGLDPAMPLFTANKPEAGLDAGDAFFVDVIHTAGNVLGVHEPLGHADFYPNGGFLQPGCDWASYPTGLEVICSHDRAVAFFAESITSEVGFTAVLCTSWEDFKAGKCNKSTSNNTAYMGEPCTKKAHGSYYLTTSCHEPFAIPVISAENIKLLVKTTNNTNSTEEEINHDNVKLKNSS